MLTATMCGVICCGSDKQLGNSLDVSRRTILRHLTSCFYCKSCSKETPDAAKVLADLRSQIESIFVKISSRNGEVIINQQLPKYLRRTGYTCRRCAYTCMDRERMRAHLNSKRSKCKGTTKAGSLKSSQIQCNNSHGIMMNRNAISKIRNGNFDLPWKKVGKETQMATRPTHGATMVSSPPANISATANNSQPSITSALTLDSSQRSVPRPDQTDNSFEDSFFATQDEIETVTAQNYIPIASRQYNNILDALAECFGDNNIHDVLPFMNTFLHRIDHASGISLKAYMMEMMQIMESASYNNRHDDICLKILLLAGEKWLTSEAANNHVRELSAGHRAKLYNIGATEGGEEEEMLKGKSFVPTREVDNLVSVFKKLVIFLHRIGWVGIRKHMSQIREVMTRMQADSIDEGEFHRIVTERIVDLNIIPGMLMRVMLDEPESPNGPTVIDDFIAVCSVTVDCNKEIKIRSPNRISKEVNNLLRLGRHGAASFYNIMKRRMKNSNKTDAEFRDFTDKSIMQVSASLFTDSCCKNIRQAREISYKTPSVVHKAHDPESGEIMIGQIVIPKIIWNRAIPFAIELLDEPFQELYKGNKSLRAWLNTNNSIDWAGRRSSLTIWTKDDDLMKVFLTDLHPILDRGAQKHIDKIWETLRGAMSYLSSGATRGREGGRLPGIDSWTLIFNVLRFQTFSLKNETHGQANNTMVNRYLPPSISRYAIIAFYSLYPSVESNPRFTLPGDDKAETAADKTFQIIMHLDKPQGPKFNRDAIGVLSNLNFPKFREKTTTADAFARQFSHSSTIHAKFYSSEQYHREGNGLVIGHELLVARAFHTMFGEPESSYSRTTENTIEDGSTVDADALRHAATHAYQDTNANVNQIQLQAIQTIDDVNNRKNVIVLAGCGMGKSGMYILPHIARRLRGMARRKTLVISPHNPLLCQHHAQAIKYFKGLPLTVVSIEMIDHVFQNDFPKSFDLGFISIHVFQQLVSKHPDVIKSWNLNTFFVDEIHLVYTELFRYKTSWDALRNLSKFGVKIVCLSASINDRLAHHIVHFINMGETAFIGNPNKIQYKIPNIAINVFRTIQSNLMTKVGAHVVSHFKRMNANFPNKKPYGIHIITRTRQQAIDGAEYCKRHGMTSIWLTSKCTRVERIERMNEYSNGDIDAIWTTYNVGYDSPRTHMGVEVEPKSVVASIQGAGRMRPKQQQALETNGNLSQYNVFLTNESLTFTTKDEITQSVSLMTRYGMMDGAKKLESRQNLYRTLFSNCSINNVFSGNKCYRQSLYEKIGVNSVVCGLCSVCRKSDNISRMETKAKEAAQSDDVDKQYVRRALHRLEQTCICGKNNCMGRNCVTKGKSCHKCFGQQCIGIQDHRKCKFNNPTINNACVFCWLPASLRRGMENETHGRGKCLHGERIKRVLLHGCRNGEDAYKSLHLCWNVERDWVTIFAAKHKEMCLRQR